MRYQLLFCALFISISASGMIQSQQETIEARRDRCKAELLKDFETKKDFFERNPVVHRHLREGVSYLKVKAERAQQNKNISLLTILATEGFLEPEREFELQNTAVQQDPDAPRERKVLFQSVIDTIRNTTRFFTMDSTEDFRPFTSVSSHRTVNQICKDPLVLDAYHQFQAERTYSNHLKFLTIFRNKQIEVMRRYGLQFPECNTEGNLSLTKFLELNEMNRAFHYSEDANPKNILITMAIIDLYLSSFGESQKSTEFMLASVTQDLQRNKARMTGGFPEINPCDIQ